MSDYNTPTTELEAINMMLEAIRSGPVSTLVNPTSVRVVKAIDILKRECRAIQVDGCSFNTDLGYKLTPDVSDEIVLPTNSLRVDPVGQYNTLGYVERGGKLYDSYNHTYTFTDQVTADVILLLPFDTLPEHARAAIVAIAARTFQEGTKGDTAADTKLARAEHLAQSAFRRVELRHRPQNILNSSWSTMRVLQRK